MAYRRSASLATLRARAQLLARTRDFFAQRGVLEIETPVLSIAGNSDPSLIGIATEIACLGGARHFLHTSPEYAMKRLLASGSGDIYQICRVFRDHELGTWHQPEFTILEWYRVGWNEVRLMTEVEELIRSLLDGSGAVAAVERITHAKAFQRYLGTEPSSPPELIVDALRAKGIDVPRELSTDALLDLALSTAIVPAFPASTLALIYDFPASQAALARIKPSVPPVAARFEAFLGGIELANGFHELTDAAEQRARFDAENGVRRARGMPTMPLDLALLAALESGLPPCAGVAVGFDRLAAAALGTDRLSDVLAFAHTDQH